MSTEKNQNLEIDQRGAELVEIENSYLDGEFDLESTKRRIRQSMVIAAQQVFFMGRDFVMLKENSTHGEFLDILDELGVNYRTANRYMSIALKFSSPKMQKLVNSISSEKGVFTKLLELSTESDDDLEALVEGGTLAGLRLDDIDRMSNKELKLALRKSKQQASEDKAANDRVLEEKNKHANELAKKLAIAQDLPEKERWKEQQAVFDKEMAAYSLDAEELLNTVHSLILTVNIPADGELQSHSARKSMALHSMNRVNVLANKLGQMQNDVFAEFSEFINEPTYQLSDPMSMQDEGEAEL